MCLQEDNLIFKYKSKNIVCKLLEEGGAEQNWLQNSEKSKVVFSEDATLHVLVILNKQKFSF
jgi:hypothetical protein